MIDSFQSSGNFLLFQIELTDLWISELCPTPCFNQFCRNLISSCCFAFIGLVKSNPKLKNIAIRYWLSCTYFGVLNIITAMCIQKLIKIVPTLSQNTGGLCNQTILPIIYCISARIMTILKFTVIPMKVPDIFILLLVSSTSIFSLDIFLLLCPDMFSCHMSYISYTIYIHFVWIQ